MPPSRENRGRILLDFDEMLSIAAKQALGTHMPPVKSKIPPSHTWLDVYGFSLGDRDRQGDSTLIPKREFSRKDRDEGDASNFSILKPHFVRHLTDQRCFFDPSGRVNDRPRTSVNKSSTYTAPSSKKKSKWEEMKSRKENVYGEQQNKKLSSSNKPKSESMSGWTDYKHVTYRRAASAAVDLLSNNKRLSSYGPLKAGEFNPASALTRKFQKWGEKALSDHGNPYIKEEQLKLEQANKLKAMLAAASAVAASSTAAATA
jgi:hypothetical protein